jgi:hypothetical protein
MLPCSRERHATWRRCPSNVHPVKAPEPLIVSWQGRQVRVRHDDVHLGRYAPRGAVIRSAIELASDVEGLRRFLATTVGDRYRVRVADDGSVIGLWRRGEPDVRGGPPLTGRADAAEAASCGYAEGPSARSDAVADGRWAKTR